jgi:hypothetical protein
MLYLVLWYIMTDVSEVLTASRIKVEISQRELAITVHGKFENPESKIPFGKPVRGWEYNIKTDLK